MAAGLKVGDRVTVGTLHPLSRIDPPMLKYVGESGTVVLDLPAEMGFPPMKRVEFDNKNLEPLGFMARELRRI